MKVTKEIADYILSNKDKTLKELQKEIEEKFGVHLHISTIEIHRRRGNYKVQIENRKVTPEIANFLYQNYSMTAKELREVVYEKWNIKLSDKTIRRYRNYSYNDIQYLRAYSWLNNNLDSVILELFDEYNEFTVYGLIDTLYIETGRRVKETTIKSKLEKYLGTGLIKYREGIYKLDRDSLAYKFLFSDEDF